MIDIEDIRKLLYAVLDGEKIKESKIELGVTTTELPSMKLKKFYKEDMKTNPLEYILASIYLPIFSQQRIIDGKHYLDIAKYRRYPIEMLREMDCDNVYVVNIEAHNKNKIQRPLETIYPEKDKVTFIDYETKPSILDFSHEQSKKNYIAGYETTIKILEKTLK